jgi:hypothetical protein
MDSSSERSPKQAFTENDDPDVLFCLSLVDTVKRLEAAKNPWQK